MSTLLGKSPGQPEEDQNDNNGAIATIISSTDPAQDPTAGLLLNYTTSGLINTGTMHNFISRHVVKKAWLRLIKRLSCVVSLINGAELSIVGVFRKTLRITNGNRQTSLQVVTLRSVDLHEFNIVLGMPWIMTAKLVFHWDQRE